MGYVCFIWWPIYIINWVDKTKLSCNTPTYVAPQFLQKPTPFDHFIGWKLSFCLPIPTLSSQTRTQSLFTGQIGLFQRESGRNRVEHGGIYEKKRAKNDTPGAFIHLSIQFALPKTSK